MTNGDSEQQKAGYSCFLLLVFCSRTNDAQNGRGGVTLLFRSATGVHRIEKVLL